jgi:hypothetical protein
MARRGLFLTIALVLAACGSTAPAAAAPSRLVYVKGTAFLGTIYAARADGTHKKKLQRGAYPALSPNGRWIGYVSANRRELRLIPRSGGEFLQTTISDRDLFTVEFSPDSKLVGVTSPTRLYINDINTGETIKTARGRIAGWSFSPDSKQVVYAKAAVGSEYGSPSDLYVLDVAARKSSRLATAGLNPLWTSAGVVHDRLGEISAGGFPHFELVRDGQPLVSSPPAADDLTSGLAPVDASSDGARVLASFEGQSRNDPYAVEGGSARLLTQATVSPTDLSRDGSTVLAYTGVGDPSDPANVVTIPWGGGQPKVLVRNATWARWNR